MVYKKLYDYAIWLGRMSVIAMLANILLFLALFYFGGWLFEMLHIICLLAFSICFPATLIFGVLAAIYYFKEKKRG